MTLSRTYSAKEVFLTVQGEGGQAGRTAVFLRFAGCNLWSGLERNRLSAICTFCDTNFVGTDGDGGGKFRSPEAMAAHVASMWRGRDGDPKLVVCTGGEPLMQLDRLLIDALHEAGFEIAIETNGTLAAPDGIDWICVSPKALPLVARRGDELKLVYPNPRLSPADVEGLGFRHLLLQPMDDTDAAANTAAAVAFCLDNPHWRLTLQNHKHVGIR